MTKIFGVVGDPIHHSLSPLIHNGWHRDFGIDAKYLAFQVPKGEFDSALATLTERGVMGLNVTLPHKVAAFEVADSHSDDSMRVGAANTLIRTPEGRWRAENTDLSGFRRVLSERVGDLSGKSALVLGAGGAARAVCAALLQLGAYIAIANRTREWAMDLAGSLGLPEDAVVPLSAVSEGAARDDLVVNCLSLGHSGGELVLPNGEGRLFYDISYGKAADPMLTHAASLGWETEDGLSMLVAQAADSFEMWHGQAPDRAAAMESCRTALRAVS